jgi:DeoR/GlpR family transcriptional regulator of sugar metabolism
MQRECAIDELAEKMHVSTLTIRRDLNDLVERKLIVRTYGGCMIGGMSVIESEYHKKVTTNYEMKQAIGKAAARHVSNGDVILINDGSTTYHLATNLGRLESLTVFTNSIAMISAFNSRGNIVIYLLGGRYNIGYSHVSGSLTEQILEKMSCDMVFLGVDAIDPEGGCLSKTIEDARMSQIMLKAGRKKVLLADSTKIKGNGYFRFTSLHEFDLFITNKIDDTDLLQEFRKMTTIQEVK